jgi:hypothetical protein
MRRPLGINKGETWAYRETTSTPLVPVTVMNQPEHYGASITIRIVAAPARGLFSVKRVKLPCKWERVEDYLQEHPDIPRELPAPREGGPSDHEHDPIGASATDLFSVGEATMRRIIREELAKVVGVPRLSLNYAQAAVATGYSVGALRNAVAKGDLFPVYANSKPVFTLTELQGWVDALPLEPN